MKKPGSLLEWVLIAASAILLLMIPILMGFYVGQTMTVNLYERAVQTTPSPLTNVVAVEELEEWSPTIYLEYMAQRARRNGGYSDIQNLQEAQIELYQEYVKNQVVPAWRLPTKTELDRWIKAIDEAKVSLATITSTNTTNAGVIMTFDNGSNVVTRTYQGGTRVLGLNSTVVFYCHELILNQNDEPCPVREVIIRSGPTGSLRSLSMNGLGLVTSDSYWPDEELDMIPD